MAMMGERRLTNCERNTEAKEMCERFPNPGEPRWELVPENDTVFVTCVRRLIDQGRDVSKNVFTCLQEAYGRTTSRGVSLVRKAAPRL